MKAGKTGKIRDKRTRVGSCRTAAQRRADRKRRKR